MRTLPLLICLLGFLTENVSAQTAGSFPAGSYVRAAVGGHWRYGTFEQAVPDSLILGVGKSGTERLALPLSSVLRLEARTGRRSHAITGLLMGSLIGFAGGAAAGNALCTSSGGLFESDCADAPVPELVGGAMGGLVLGGMGALIGWAIRTDRWEEVPLQSLRVGLTSRPGGSIEAGLSMRF